VPARELRTTSPEETEAVGEALGRAARGGELIGLVGDLGAGKTCLVRGLARGLGIDPDRVCSPTFVTATEYGGGRLPLHHVDLYRFEGPVDDSGWLREILYGDGVAVVEWFDRLAPIDDALAVHLAAGPGDVRVLRVGARGARHDALLARADFGARSHPRS
jgi:tRNA threonylcarbamoyladenosine biosynthesis protein TsaE